MICCVIYLNVSKDSWIFWKLTFDFWCSDSAANPIEAQPASREPSKARHSESGRILGERTEIGTPTASDNKPTPQGAHWAAGLTGVALWTLEPFFIRNIC